MAEPRALPPARPGALAIGAGLAVLLLGTSAVLWARFGPALFLDALNAVWTCF